MLSRTADAAKLPYAENAARLRAFRLLLNMGRAEVCALVGIELNGLSQYERGRSALYKHRLGFARAFRLTPEQFDALWTGTITPALLRRQQLDSQAAEGVSGSVGAHV